MPKLSDRIVTFKSLLLSMSQIRHLYPYGNNKNLEK